MSKAVESLDIEGSKRLGGGLIRMKRFPDEVRESQGYRISIRTEIPDPQAVADGAWWIGLNKEQVREMVIWLAKSLMDDEDD